MSVQVEPTVSYVGVLGLVLVLVGEEFDCKSLVCFRVLYPISVLAAVPLGGS